MKPLLLTEVVPAPNDPLASIVPSPELWRSANATLGHPRGCRCSTCSLAARLGQVVRNQVAST